MLCRGRVALYYDDYVKHFNTVRGQNEELFSVKSGGTYSYHWSLTLRRLMSYIYGAPILDVSRSHTTTQHSR